MTPTTPRPSRRRLPAVRLAAAGLVAMLAVFPLSDAGAQTGCSPTLGVTPDRASAGSRVIVSGSDFYERCDQPPFVAMRDIGVEFAQGSRVVTLAFVDARASGQFEVEVRVPSNATAGAASFRARSPQGVLLAAREFTVAATVTPRPATPRPPVAPDAPDAPAATPVPPQEPVPVETPEPIPTPAVPAPVETPEPTPTPTPTPTPRASPSPSPVVPAPVQTPEPVAETTFSAGPAIAGLALLALVGLAIALIARRRDQPVAAAAWTEPAAERTEMMAAVPVPVGREERFVEPTEPYPPGGGVTPGAVAALPDEDQELGPYDEEEYIPVAGPHADAVADDEEEEILIGDEDEEEEILIGEEDDEEILAGEEDDEEIMVGDEEEEEILFVDDEDWEPVELEEPTVADEPVPAPPADETPARPRATRRRRSPD